MTWMLCWVRWVPRILGGGAGTQVDRDEVRRGHTALGTRCPRHAALPCAASPGHHRLPWAHPAQGAAAGAAGGLGGRRAPQHRGCRHSEALGRAARVAACREAPHKRTASLVLPCSTALSQAAQRGTLLARCRLLAAVAAADTVLKQQPAARRRRARRAGGAASGLCGRWRRRRCRCGRPRPPQRPASGSGPAAPAAHAVRALAAAGARVPWGSRPVPRRSLVLFGPRVT
jgi:hypothetical protein